MLVTYLTACWSSCYPQFASSIFEICTMFKTELTSVYFIYSCASLFLSVFSFSRSCRLQNLGSPFLDHLLPTYLAITKSLLLHFLISGQSSLITVHSHCHCSLGFLLLHTWDTCGLLIAHHPYSCLFFLSLLT